MGQGRGSQRSKTFIGPRAAGDLALHGLQIEKVCMKVPVLVGSCRRNGNTGRMAGLIEKRIKAETGRHQTLIYQ